MYIHICDSLSHVVWETLTTHPPFQCLNMLEIDKFGPPNFLKQEGLCQPNLRCQVEIRSKCIDKLREKFLIIYWYTTKTARLPIGQQIKMLSSVWGQPNNSAMTWCSCTRECMYQFGNNSLQCEYYCNTLHCTHSLSPWDSPTAKSGALFICQVAWHLRSKTCNSQWEDGCTMI